MSSEFSASYQRITAQSDSRVLIKGERIYRLSAETILLQIGHNFTLNCDRYRKRVPLVLFIANDSRRFNVADGQIVWVIGMGTFRYYRDPEETRLLPAAPLRWSEFMIEEPRDPRRAFDLLLLWFNRWRSGLSFECCKDCHISFTNIPEDEERASRSQLELLPTPEEVVGFTGQNTAIKSPEEIIRQSSQSEGMFNFLLFYRLCQQWLWLFEHVQQNNSPYVGLYFERPGDSIYATWLRSNEFLVTVTP